MTITEVAMKRLVDQHGWAADRVLDNIVMKHFQTAVGLKQASVRIKDDSEGGRYWLSAEYQSEGRNALEACSGIVSATADVPQAHAEVDAFVIEVNRQIGETYAARLLRRWGT
jgi:hypothetical protein